MITGGMGFVGSHLCDRLVNDNEIIVITKSNSKNQNLKQILSKITIEYLDIIDYPLLEKTILKYKPEIIIHLAGQTSHSQSFADPLYDIDVNAKSTLYILETLRKHNIQCKFILGSTFIVIGKPLNLPVDESTPCNPTTIYCTNRSWVDAMFIMKSSSIVVVPSRIDSLPTTVKEAFFLNIPVVATNVGGIPELITHDKTGILVAPNDPEKLADAINNLLVDRVKSEKLAVNANIFLKNNMTWDVILPKFINFYEKLLK